MMNESLAQFIAVVTGSDEFFSLVKYAYCRWLLMFVQSGDSQVSNENNPGWLIFLIETYTTH